VSISWLKGHGTRNDFVLLPDPDGSLLDLGTPWGQHVVRLLCDRHEGLGADGVLRVVRTKAVRDAAAVADQAEWFMDYRNADGSVAEMCGNGIRVFVRYLHEGGLVGADDPVLVATRGGVRRVDLGSDGQLTVEMGRAEPLRADDKLLVDTTAGPRPAVGIALPNPHAVVFVDDLAQAGPLTAPPGLLPEGAFPDGVNVEFVVRVAERHIAMRVHERGVGETLSCGTGACAAAVASMRRDGATAGSSYIVDVPGGRLLVSVDADDEVRLTGPAELTLRGSLDLAPP